MYTAICHIEEKRLLRELVAGSETAFTVLLKHYWNNIYAHALAYLKSSDHAKDLVQDIFLGIWQKKHLLENIDSFENYLFIVARNKIISELRKKLILTVEADAGLQIPDLSNHEPDEIFSCRQLEKELSYAIGQLPARQKTAFVLSRNEGMSYELIADKMGVSKDAVKKHIKKALQFLRHKVYHYAEPGSRILLAISFLFSIA